MKTYEVAVVLHPDLEIDLEAPLSRLDEALSSVGADVKKRDDWGKRKLAYAIEGQNFGIYSFYTVDMEPSRVAELQQALQMNEEVMRHLIVTYEEDEEDNRKAEAEPDEGASASDAAEPESSDQQ